MPQLIAAEIRSRAAEKKKALEVGQALPFIGLGESRAGSDECCPFAPLLCSIPAVACHSEQSVPH